MAEQGEEATDGTGSLRAGSQEMIQLPRSDFEAIVQTAVDKAMDAHGQAAGGAGTSGGWGGGGGGGGLVWYTESYLARSRFIITQ